jgi:hypothetical protein
MIKRMCVVSLAITLLVLGAFFVVPVMADEAFHVTSRQENVSSDDSTITGLLILNVYNTSGEVAQDLEAWVEGPNSVTYDNHRIFLGTLAEGDQIEVLDTISAPAELAGPRTADETVVWTLEYTNSAGQRVTIQVAGQTIQ